MKRKFLLLLCLQSLYVYTSEKNGNNQSIHSLPASSGPIRRGQQAHKQILDEDPLKFFPKVKTGQTLSHEHAKNSEDGSTLENRVTKRPFSAVIRNVVSDTNQNKQESSSIQNSVLMYHGLPNKTLLASTRPFQGMTTNDKNSLSTLTTTEVVSSPKNDAEVAQSIDPLSKNKRLRTIEEKLDTVLKDTKEERAVVSEYLSKIITLQERMEQMFANIGKSIENIDTKIKSLETKIDNVRTHTASK